jgi:hypothetical protein
VRRGRELIGHPLIIRVPRVVGVRRARARAEGQDVSPYVLVCTVYRLLEPDRTNRNGWRLVKDRVFGGKPDGPPRALINSESQLSERLTRQSHSTAISISRVTSAVSLNEAYVAVLRGHSLRRRSTCTPNLRSLLALQAKPRAADS